MSLRKNKYKNTGGAPKSPAGKRFECMVVMTSSDHRVMVSKRGGKK